MRRHLGCSLSHQIYKTFDPYINPHSYTVQGTDQPEAVGELRVGELRRKDSDVIKITGKFVAERRYSSSETGSQNTPSL